MVNTANAISALPIEKTYCLFEDFEFLKELYQKEYTSLPEKSTDDLLQYIRTEFQASKLKDYIDPNTSKHLINPNYSQEVSKLIEKIRQEKPELYIQIQNNTCHADDFNLIKRQLAEFIYCSKLSHFVAKTPSGWGVTGYAIKMTLNKGTLESFAALSKLKFNIFFYNLNNYLNHTTIKNHELENLTKMLISNYLPHVATAEYSYFIQLFLTKQETNPDEIKQSIEKLDIPALKKCLQNYQDRISSLENANAEYASSNKDAVITDTIDGSYQEDTISLFSHSSYTSCSANSDILYCEAEDNKTSEKILDPSYAHNHKDTASIHSAEAPNPSVGKNPFAQIWHWFKTNWEKLKNKLTKPASYGVETTSHPANMRSISNCNGSVRCNNASTQLQPTLADPEDWKKGKGAQAHTMPSIAGNPHLLHTTSNTAVSDQSDSPAPNNWRRYVRRTFS
jgi:hypothetical protein